MQRLILMRHGPVRVDASRPAETWELTNEGKGRVLAFTERLRPLGIDRVVSSLEPKAAATARIVGDTLQRPCISVHGLEEHHRHSVGFFPAPEEFRAAVVEALRHPGERRLGEETVDAARARFGRAVVSAQQRQPDETLCVVAHGTVISAYAAHLTAADPVELWCSLGLPAAIVLDLDDRRIVEVL